MRQIDNLPRDAWMKLLMDGMTRQAERTQIKNRVINTYLSEQKLMKRHGSEIADLVCRAHRSKERLEQQVRDNDERLKNLRQESEEEMQRRRKRREESEERLTDAQQGLAKALGLELKAPFLLLAFTFNRINRQFREH
ncbi:hypothetical protein HR074_17420 [Escherichia coli]|uniref:hypothetical protein n=1 Tax=Escherichia coli TaxID=562 RepID=UPI00159382BA|nr:hypothetical protein [Escherichia coli]QKY35729.1 hypothetical protein HR074_17420 [Escherichia coli]